MTNFTSKKSIRLALLSLIFFSVIVIYFLKSEGAFEDQKKAPSAYDLNKEDIENRFAIYNAVNSYAITYGLRPGQAVNAKDLLALLPPDARINPITHQEYGNFIVDEFPSSNGGVNSKNWNEDKKILEMDDDRIVDFAPRSNNEFTSILTLVMIEARINELQDGKEILEESMNNKKINQPPRQP